MVALPLSLSWSLRVLGEGDRERILSVLERDPIRNVYMIARIRDEGLTSAAHAVEIRSAGGTIAVGLLAGNIVLAANPEADDREIEIAMSMIADRIRARAIPLRAIISDARLVEPLWLALRAQLDPPTVIRMNQPIYLLDHEVPGLSDLSEMRFAESADLDDLVPACAAMHREEVGIDPLERDAAGYRMRVFDLIEKRRALIMRRDGTIVFKCEFSAVTHQAVQLMGVWTNPDSRRLGFARIGLQEVCGHVLRSGRSVTLFVNDFNTPAIHLYESLGFRSIGVNRALIW